MTVSGPGPVKPAVVTFPPTPVRAHVAVDVRADPHYSFSSSVPASSDLSPSVDLTPPAPDPKVLAVVDAAVARAAGKVDWKVLALILTGDLLGTGLLTVPNAYAQLGWVPATSAITALFFLTTYTGIRLHSLRAPGISSYAGLFHAHLGSAGRVYAAFCVHALLFMFVAGSLQVAQSSWRALFPNICGAVWVAVVGVVAWIALQARSMPAIGVLGGVSVVSAIVPVVVVIGVLREDVLRGTRAPGETSLWFGGAAGGEGGGAMVSLMDLLFAFAGHAVFFEYVYLSWAAFWGLVGLLSLAALGAAAVRRGVNSVRGPVRRESMRTDSTGCFMHTGLRFTGCAFFSVVATCVIAAGSWGKWFSRPTFPRPCTSPRVSSS